MEVFECQIEIWNEMGEVEFTTGSHAMQLLLLTFINTILNITQAEKYIILYHTGSEIQ